MALFTWVLPGEPGQSLQCGEGGSARQQDRVPGPAPRLPGEDQLLGGGEEGQEARGGRHWKAASLTPASSRFLSALLLSGPLCPVGSMSLPLPVFSVSVSRWVLLSLYPAALGPPLSFPVSLSPCISFCFCLSFAPSTSLFPPFFPSFCLSSSPCSASVMSPLGPSVPFPWAEIRDLGRETRGGEVGQEAWRRGEQGRDKRPLQRSREKMARSEPVKAARWRGDGERKTAEEGASREQTPPLDGEKGQQLGEYPGERGGRDPARACQSCPGDPLG